MIFLVITCVVLISSSGIASSDEKNEEYPCNKCNEWEICMDSPSAENEKTCVCIDSNCGTDPCDSNPCENGGECRKTDNSFYCDCIDPFIGYTCSNILSCDEPCENGGKCKWNGEKMECEDPCEPNPCENGGKCEVTQSSYHCVCVGSFVGQNCSYAIDETHTSSIETTEVATTTELITTSTEEVVSIDYCFIKECRNNGKCKVEGITAKCECISPYVGDDCSEVSESPITSEDTTIVSNSPTTSVGTTIVSNSPTTSVDTTIVSNSPTTSVDTTIVSNSPTTSVDTTIVSNSPTTSVDTTIVSNSPTTSVDTTIVSNSPTTSGDTTIELKSTTSRDTTIETKSPTTSRDTTIEFITTTSEVTPIDHDSCISNPCLNNGSCIRMESSVRCNCTYPFSGEFCDTDLSEKIQSSSNSIVYACTGSVVAIFIVFLIGFSVLWRLKRAKLKKRESYFHNADLSSMESENSRTYII